MKEEMPKATNDQERKSNMSRYNELATLDVSNPAPRCPVVLLLDTSKSMKGAPIKELEEALVQFITEVKDDVAAAASVELCIVTLDENATVQIPFTSAMDLEARKPGLKAAGGTFTGKALGRAFEQITQRRKNYAENGILSYAPWVVLMTDGKPGDKWEVPAQKLLAMANELRMQYIGIAIGEQANTEILRRMLPAHPGPLRLSHLRFKEFFRWLSDSLSVVSRSSISDVDARQR